MSLPDFHATDDLTEVVRLSTQYPDGAVAIPRADVRLTWRVDGPDGRQLGYQIVVDDSIGADRAVAGEESVGVVAPGGALGEGEVRSYRVRVATAKGWSRWSTALHVEGALDRPFSESIAIGRNDDRVGGPATLLRTRFDLPARPRRAVLRNTFFGVGEFRINGRRVDDEHLNPGWTSYQSRVVYGTWDVTHLVQESRNVLAVVVGDGWFRGRLGWEHEAEHYGSSIGALARLDMEFDDEPPITITTDQSWRTSTGSIRMNSLYDGTDVDLRAEPSGWQFADFDDSAWDAAVAIDVDTSVVEPRIAAGVRTVDEIEGVLVDRPGGTRVDVGQNIAGWLRLVVHGRAGDQVTVRHAEVLEPDGRLHLRSLRTARAADVYILAQDGTTTLEPALTFHGFRYADVAGARVISAVAVAISSANTPRSSFESSVPALNQLHSNTLWSQRDNFVSLPTDCPQRDERLGWTGDAQAFAATASTLFDVEAFWTSWLRDLELDQDESGAVAAVVPNVLKDFVFPSEKGPSSIMGRAGWADAATIVPWAVRDAYGSDEILVRQLGSMRRWVDHLTERAGDAGLLPTEFQFGDWLDPDAPGDRPEQAKVSADFVANAFWAHSARLLGRAEDLVGDAGEGARYIALGDDVAARTWTRWGEEALGTQTGAALALEFALVPPAERERVGTSLGDLVRAADGRIATGFLGTPLILHALVHADRIDEAYLMLLRREAPSWLYQVDQGATTVWERWDAILPDGSIHDGDTADGTGMLSFNHYAYGAVVDWLYRYVAGIGTSTERPGYRSVVVSPRPAAGLDWARARVESRLGEVAIDWKVTGGHLEVELVLPFGSEAVLDLPTTSASEVLIDGRPQTEPLRAGRHSITVSYPKIATTR